MLKKIGFSLLVVVILSSFSITYAAAPIDTEKTKTESKQEEKNLIQFDKQIVKDYLIKEEKLEEWKANLMVDTVLPHMSAQLQPVLDAYLANRTIDSKFYVRNEKLASNIRKDITMPFIMKGYKCGFWPALTYMDIFIQHPDNSDVSYQMFVLPWMVEDAAKNKAPKQVSNQSGTKKTIQFDKHFVKILLIKEEKCLLREADELVNLVLPQMHAELQPVVDEYLADRTINSSFNVKGVTMSKVMEGYGCDFWSALIEMNGFIDHPEDTIILSDPNLYPKRFIRDRGRR